MHRAGAAGFESAAQDVLEHESAEVADVGGSVNRGSAAVETEGRAVDRSEFAFGAGERVEEPHARRVWRLAAVSQEQMAGAGRPVCGGNFRFL